MTKIIVEYDPIRGTPVRDGEVKNFVDYLATLTQNDAVGCDTVRVANELVIDRIRVAVKRHQIDVSNIVIMFDGTVIEMSPDGMIQSWPKGFCDYQMNVLTDLID